MLRASVGSFSLVAADNCLLLPFVSHYPTLPLIYLIVIVIAIVIVIVIVIVPPMNLY